MAEGGRITSNDMKFHLLEIIERGLVKRYGANWRNLPAGNEDLSAILILCGALLSAVEPGPCIQEGADRLALAVLAAVDRGEIQDRTAISDALERYADLRFDNIRGEGISLLRKIALARS